MKRLAIVVGFLVCVCCAPGEEGAGDGGQTTAPPASLTISVQPTEVSLHGGTANLSVTVLDENGNPVAVGTVVQFSISPSGMGSISPIQAATNENGVATATFTSGDVSGAVTITATAGDKSASVNITVLPPTLSSIRFISAEPSVISIQGSGGVTVSKITFEVKDSGDNPVEGVEVRFDLYGPGGGEFLDPTTSSTNSSGRAYTYLNSGNIAGPVRIIAWIIDTNANKVISAASNPISIGGGKPSYAHFSLAADLLNISGNVWYGLQDTITAFLADRFGNIITSPVTVSFFTEGGGIETGKVSAEMGQASVILQTQEPMPRDVAPHVDEDDIFINVPSPLFPSYLSACVEKYGKGTRYMQIMNPRDEIVTVIAITKGEETFFDANGNGVYDEGEDFIDIGEPFIDANDNGIWDDDEPFTDTDGNGVFTAPEPYDDQNGNCQYDPGEPFTDLNGNGVYDYGDDASFVDVNGNGKWDPHEFYFDANGNGQYDGPNGKWDDDIDIWKEIKIVFSMKAFFSSYYFGLCDLDCESNCIYTYPCGTTFSVGTGKCLRVRRFLIDSYGNPPVKITALKIDGAEVGGTGYCGSYHSGCSVIYDTAYFLYSSPTPSTYSVYLPYFEITYTHGDDDRTLEETVNVKESEGVVCTFTIQP